MDSAMGKQGEIYKIISQLIDPKYCRDFASDKDNGSAQPIPLTSFTPRADQHTCICLEPALNLST